jgi:hypothetical protein
MPRYLKRNVCLPCIDGLQAVKNAVSAVNAMLMSLSENTRTNRKRQNGNVTNTFVFVEG